jgi:hypothetical protein
VAIDFDDVLTRGGHELIRFLHFCVYSVEMAPLFVALAKEYRFRPTVPGALALYECFCAQDAPARIRADVVLWPRDMRLERMISRLRQEVQIFEAAVQASSPAEGAESSGTRRRTPPPPAPVVFLFDHVVEHLAGEGAGTLDTAARAFDPAREPMENLPGGRLTAGQRAFLENVWRPRIRPRLVSAGFWRAANLGQ